MRTLDEQEIYDELPAKLRADLLLHRYKEIVEKARASCCSLSLTSFKISTEPVK